MIPGPANVLTCPFCGGKKEVISLISGNTYSATVWSDTRREYPMLPEVSPVQQCPHCQKYYFVEQAQSEHDRKKESFELGTLNFSQLKEAKKQMDGMSLAKMQRWILNHQLFMAYNDCYRRNLEKVAFPPSEEDEVLFATTISELLEGIERTEEYDMFHAELLRESGRFAEAKKILEGHTSDDDRWVVDAMLRHIEGRDTMPFLLINNGEIVQ